MTSVAFPLTSTWSLTFTESVDLLSSAGREVTVVDDVVVVEVVDDEDGGGGSSVGGGALGGGGSAIDDVVADCDVEFIGASGVGD